MKHWFTPAFVLMLTLLVGSELIVRTFYQRSMSGRFEYGYNLTSGFVENADGTVNLVRAGGRRFIPQTFSKARPAGVFRIFVIGDSVPRGPNLAASYAAQIGDKLRALGIKAESFNMGIAGNGVRRNQIVLRKALDYEPSLIILHVNNSNEFEDEREYQRAQQFKSWHPKNWLMKSFAIRRLYEAKTEKIYWSLVAPEIRNLAAVSDADAELRADQNPEKLREWDERVSKTTAESVAIARAHNVPILLLTQAVCDRDASGQATLDDRGLDALAQSLAGPGIYFLSMKQIFENSDFAPLFSDGTHLHPAGHERIADTVVKDLLREKIVAANKGS